MDLEKKAEVLKALGQPTRLRIMEYLRDGERCVCEIFPAIGGQQSNVSRHLAVLKQAGLVSDRREGVSIYYRVLEPSLFKLLDDLGRKK
jgi:DNA-binding transcriptional ArsR family regulator